MLFLDGEGSEPVFPWISWLRAVAASSAVVWNVKIVIFEGIIIVEPNEPEKKNKQNNNQGEKKG